MRYPVSFVQLLFLGILGAPLLSSCFSAPTLDGDQPDPSGNPDNTVSRLKSTDPLGLIDPPSLTQPAIAPANSQIIPSADSNGQRSVRFSQLTGAPTALKQCKTVSPETCPLPIVTPSSDIWVRLRAGFALDPSLHRAQVQTHIDWFRRNPDYIDRVLKRGAPYLPHILTTIESSGLPLEFVLLPVIESAFDPFAYSPGRASGLWQFIPATARLYGLKIDWWYDGRRDLIDSTDAAARFLSDLGRSLDRDWPLALASYNAGIGTVRRAIRKNKRQAIGTQFWDLPLPRETQNYVPKLLALTEIIRNPERYQINLPQVSSQTLLSQVFIPHQIDLSKVAELANESLDTVYRLNPGFNQWATHPEGPHRLVLPADKALSFQTAFANTPANERIRWVRHRIAQGETLGSIANRYGLSVQAIQQINDLDGALIIAGKPLLIPQAALSDYPLSLTGRDIGRVHRFEKAMDQTAQRYTVKEGDSFWSIAKKFNVSISNLTKWNGLSPKKHLSVGQTLAVFNEGGLIGEVVQNPLGKQQSDPRIRSVTYQIRRGDSLSKIAARFNTSITQIKQWNPFLVDQRYLQPGDRLTLRLDVKKAY